MRYLWILILGAACGVFSAAGEERVCACCARYNDKNHHEEEKVVADLALRAAKQRAAAAKLTVTHDFAFTDQPDRGGIGFQHKIVDDSGRDWKPVHYDHGNGVIPADVDGDGLVDIYFLSQLGGNQLWRNKGNGRFEDITAIAGVAVADRIGVSAVFGDIDNDGDPDLYVTSVRGGNLLFENMGEGRFRDITAAAGLNYSGHSSAALFLDYNSDGLLDLLLTNVGVYTTAEKGRDGYYIGYKDAFAGHLKTQRNEASILYKNLGKNKFADVSAAAGISDTSWSGDAVFADLNGDRLPDIYLFNMQGDDHYYQNQAGKHFADLSASTFPVTPWGTMSGKFFDYNGDGHFDLYLTDMHSDMSEKVEPDKETLKSNMQWPDSLLQDGSNNIFGNAFFENYGTSGMLEVSDAVGLENYWPWGISVADLNADGFEDIFVVASMNYPFRYAPNSVYLNNAGKGFVDVAFPLGIEPRQGLSVTPWFDLDCGGADKEHERCAGQTEKITVWGARGSRSSLIFDCDGDGDNDILLSEFNEKPRLLLSNLAEKHALHFLKIKLVGSKSNRDGLGALVCVKAGAQTQYRYHDGQTGYLSHGLLPLYFGLGTATVAAEVRVQWPSGTDQVLTDVPGGQMVTVKEP